VTPEVHYGKADVAVYRTHTRGLFAASVSIDVRGDNFLSAYTEGDNRQVVATDTMKNFVYAVTLEYAGATQEGFAAFLARRFLETYPQMQSLRISLRELPFAAHTEKLFSPQADDYGIVDLEADRAGLRALRAGRQNLRLVKLTGSSFAGFVRDAYTTLPEAVDRPLYICLDAFWRHADLRAAISEDPSVHIASEQVRDVIRMVFDEFVSRSIQHLVHEMGRRLLTRFPGLSEVSLEAQNRLWDTAAVSSTDPNVRVYSDPRPAYGVISLSLTRDG